MFRGKTFSLVLPAFNEESNIKKNILSFQQTEIFDEIIVVDNNSTDNTASEIKETNAYYVKETIQGYGAALRKGMGIAKSNYIVICEPDSTFKANDIYKFLSYLEEFECIFGTRTTKSLINDNAKMQFYLRIGNILVAKILEYLFFGPTLSDVGCTFKLISKKSYDSIKNNLKVIGSEFQPELMINLILKKKKNFGNTCQLFRKGGKIKNYLQFYILF